MSEDEKDSGRDGADVDLSGLSNLEFATAWTPSSTDGKSFAPRENSGRPERRRADGENQRGRRSFGQSAKFRGSGKPGRGGKFDGHKAQFAPTMEVLFYPDDAPFEKLVGIIKASKRTYQLFDIARLVLEKPERFVVLAKNLPGAGGATAPLYCAQPLNLPFDDEAAARNAAVEFYVEELFSVERVESEPPGGNFSVVNKSTVTGELLGAPNWHKYNEHLREYYRRKAPKMSFGEFAAAVEPLREPERISEWLESMKTRDVYKLKTPPEDGGDCSFDTYEAAAGYAARKMEAELVKTYEQVRMKGSRLGKLPFGRIRRNIEEECRRQRRFPGTTANNLRGRLRRSGLAVYKKGAKGVAFVSAVKRKFLFEGDTLAETPQALFDFITKNPGISAGELPYKFLGLTLSDALKRPASNAEAEPSEAETAGGVEDGEKSKINSIIGEMLWLVSEGYVVEYADSTLEANPYMPRPKTGLNAPSKTEDENGNARDEPPAEPIDPSADGGEKGEDGETGENEDAQDAAREPSEGVEGETAPTPETDKGADDRTPVDPPTPSAP